MDCRRLNRGALALAALAWAALARAQAPFTVVLDPAHGGTEMGTSLSAQLEEKTLVLDLANRLRSLLRARGMDVVLTRAGDANAPPDVRAGTANAARAGACLVLHATASGAGAHLYTSSLNPGSPSGPLTPWAGAQAPFLTASLELASEIATALGGAEIPLTLGRVRLPPLDSLACPAVAVELAPLRVTEAGKRQEASIGDAAYQQRFLEALAAALVGWRDQRERTAR